ncbi:hypothetical protein [Flammeovirga pacifica]|uniref:Response regulatory domain-containing protein n=1 Tax=Flammeovirga pacifica TaxID=915059 RepID=A0A1S1Z1E3_FLAPC|nr:hypothetical protein [Flammeovirga pacifica]OHX67062.1 hypothetical protein NH26_12250 [Flammeovirga pacifica]
MNILIGNDNELNSKLLEEIKHFIPIEQITYNKLLMSDSIDKEGILLINLLDVVGDSKEVINEVRMRYPRHKVIALHYFQVDSMIEKLLNDGFDEYVSILNFSETIHEILDIN